MTQIMPTVFVLLIAVFREGVEDYNRHKSDSVTNSRQVRRVHTDGSGLGKIEIITSAEVQAGDTLMIMDEEEFPADMVLIKSHFAKQNVNDQDFCFIQTSSLDGEKNLKKRFAPKDLQTFCV